MIACKRSPEVGSPLQIRHQTTILRVKPIKTELQRGSAREVSSESGMQMVPCYGSTENVRLLKLVLQPSSFRSLAIAGSGKTILMYVMLITFNEVCDCKYSHALPGPQSSEKLTGYARPD